MAFIDESLSVTILLMVKLASLAADRMSSSMSAFKVFTYGESSHCDCSSTCQPLHLLMCLSSYSLFLVSCGVETMQCHRKHSHAVWQRSCSSSDLVSGRSHHTKLPKLLGLHACRPSHAPGNNSTLPTL